MRLSLLAVFVAMSSFAPCTAIDEAGIIQLVSFDNTTSTGKHCVPKDYNTSTTTPERYFAITRTGGHTVLSSYIGHFNGTTSTATLNDKNMTMTLSKGANDTIRVSVQQEDGVCEYITHVAAGSVLNVTNSSAPVVEAGVIQVLDLKNASSLAVCEDTAVDINGTFAFVRSDQLTVMGGFWTHKDGNTTLLKRKSDDDVKYEVTVVDGSLTIHTDGGHNATLRATGGCAFSALVKKGSVMGVVAANSTRATSLRGADKVVCRQTCGQNVCRTVCRDYWRQ